MGSRSIVDKKISREVWGLYDSTSTGSFRDTLAGIKFWKDPKIMVLLGVFAFALFIALRNPLPAVLGGKKANEKSGSQVPVQKGSAPVSSGPSRGVDSRSYTPADDLKGGWRVVGHYKVDGVLYVQLARGGAFRTLISPRQFYTDALRAYGSLDGVPVTNYTGKVDLPSMGIRR